MKYLIVDEDHQKGLMTPLVEPEREYIPHYATQRQELAAAFFEGKELATVNIRPIADEEIPFIIHQTRFDDLNLSIKKPTKYKTNNRKYSNAAKDKKAKRRQVAQARKKNR